MCHEGEVHCSCGLTSDNISNLKKENSVVLRDAEINEAMLVHLVSAQQRPYHEQSVQVIWTRLGLQESLQNNSIGFGLPQMPQERGPFQWYKTSHGCGSGRSNPKDKTERAASSAANSITKWHTLQLDQMIRQGSGWRPCYGIHERINCIGDSQSGKSGGCSLLEKHPWKKNTITFIFVEQRMQWIYFILDLSLKGSIEILCNHLLWRYMGFYVEPIWRLFHQTQFKLWKKLQNHVNSANCFLPFKLLSKFERLKIFASFTDIL